ncbi:Autophagy-related protein 9 [Podosphaera aphanis]|nr:Autophagy-related protein 9 [Podosphaera aphanis]
MTSNIISRILPTKPTGRSVYEDLRAQNDGYDVDIETQAGLAIDEENLRFHDHELTHFNMLNDEDSSNTTTESTNLIHQQHDQLEKGKTANHGDYADRSKWTRCSPRLLTEDVDDDVPASLLIEGNDLPGPSTSNNSRIKPLKTNQKNLPVSEQWDRKHRAQFETSEARQSLHPNVTTFPRNTSSDNENIGLSGSARENALWRWTNVTNLDKFLREVYDYYTGAGIWCILLEGFLNILQVVFVAVFSTFLTQCVKFHAVPNSRKLSEVLEPHCTKKISGFSSLAIWLFTLHVFWRVYQLIADIPRLLQIRQFYLHLLEVPESDMQTISWQDVVARIMALRDANPVTVERITPSNRKFLGSQSKQRLDAHDIANRLMRRENYLIALFNKEIMDLTLPIPFLQGRQIFSRALLWNIDQCIMDLVFDDQGQVRQLILKESHRKQLSNALRGRFLFAGFMNAWLAPIIVIYLMTVYFLRYFNEYQKNPAAVGSRRYTPLAMWKFREFNELQHLFDKRINMSYPFASRYLDQFPKVKMIQFARFVAFCAGAIVSVLAVFTLWDPEMLTNFELTKDRPVVFYIGIFGAIWAITNGMIPEENLVFEPEYALRNVIDYVHFMPNHWHNRLHSDDVKKEFATMYQLKIVIFFEEVFSIIVTPLILWFSLPKCSDQIIDFFREFTVHVDGVGHVCSFAVFDFKKGDSRKRPRALDGGGFRDEYYSTKHGKMAASYYGFIDNYLLNPKTAMQGHIPPGTRSNHHPPPTFPGLMSPNVDSGAQTPRTGYSKRRSESSTPRFPSLNTYVASPLQSTLLDPHHQPSNSGAGSRNSRSRYHNRQSVIEEAVKKQSRSEVKELFTTQDENTLGLDESRWEISPIRAVTNDAENEVEVPKDAGVISLLYQFQKAQKDSGGRMNI